MSSKELFTYVLQPYLEGAERLNRAWQGVDFHSLTYASFTWAERAVFLITGIALTFFPLVNLIVWLAWQTFGNPEILSDPFLPASRNSPPPVLPAPVVAAQLISPPAIQIEKAEEVKEAEAPAPVSTSESKNRIETFSFMEWSKSFREETKWKLEFLPDSILIQADSNREKTTARYSLDWRIQEYNCYHKDAELHIELVEPRRLRVRARRENTVQEREHLLVQDYPWVQQMTLGIRDFVLAKNQNCFRFYSIRPDNCDLVEVVARKTGEAEGLVKVEVKMAHCLLRFVREGELWFEPETGRLRKLIDSGRFMETVTSELAQNTPPPGPMHP